MSAQVPTPASKRSPKIFFGAKDLDTPDKIASALSRLQAALGASLDQLRVSTQAAGIGPGAVSPAQMAPAAASALVPTGTLLAYAGAAAPPGFLICDGFAVSRTTYAALFTAIGTTYGVGDGSTTFNLPDLRDAFLRGLDNMGGSGGARGLGLAAAQGTEQQDAFQGHYHGKNYPSGFAYGAFNAGTGGQGFTPGSSDTNNADWSVGSPITDGTNGTPSTATETRPRNQATKFLIKT